MMRAMRKTITSLLALGALAVAAQPAAADDPAATTTTTDYGSGVTSTCQTPDKIGVDGQYGAWGYYIDGCTVRLTCTNVAGNCKVSSRSIITTETWAGHRVTLNSRIRIYGTDGSLRTWRDRSCEGTNQCTAQDATWMYPGESASVQCNGVRAIASNRGRVRCQVNVQRESYCTKRNTPISQLSQVDAEATVLCLTNLERYSAGLSMFTPNDQLTSAARGHAWAAVTNPWWTSGADFHTNPYTGSTPSSRIAAAGYCPSRKSISIAENTYTASGGPTPYSAVQWWMNHLGPDGTLATNGHRKNILDPGLSELGVAVVPGSANPARYPDSGTFVQDFANCINY